MKHWNADKMADAIANEIGLADDLIVREVRGADSGQDALERLEEVKQDADKAYEFLKAALDGKKPEPKAWTVVGFYEDDRTTWIEYGTGETPDAAVFDALSELRATEVNLENLTILAVFPGRLEESAFQGMGPVTASEWDGVDDEKRSNGPRRGGR